MGRQGLGVSDEVDLISLFSDVERAVSIIGEFANKVTSVIVFEHNRGWVEGGACRLLVDMAFGSSISRGCSKPGSTERQASPSATAITRTIITRISLRKFDIYLSSFIV